MKLHLITAPDTRTANERAVALYGRDVLIVSSNQVNGATELIVAADTPSLDNEINGRASAAASAGSSAATTPARVTAAPPARVTAAPPARVTAAAPAPQTRPAGKTPAVALQRFDDLLESSNAQLIELFRATKPASAASEGDAAKKPRRQPATAAIAKPRKRASKPARAAADGSARAQELVGLIRDEIQALRSEFGLTQKLSAWRTASALNPALEPLLQLLVSTGMTAGLRSLLESGLQDCQDTALALSHLETVLTAAAKPAECTADLHSGIHAFHGPSGAGTTTFIAKLANQLSQSTPVERIALISLAGQRPGAWNQIQLLAAGCGVRCFRAADGKALGLILDELPADAVVLIDAGGSSAADAAQQLGLSGRTIPLHAVVPANASLALLRRLCATSQHTTILTKLDEADYPWGLLHLMTESPLRISCCSMKPGIESHPEPFSAAALVSRLIAGIRSELDAARTAEVADLPVAAVAPLRRSPPAARKGARRA